MANRILFILIIIPICLFGQETEKILNSENQELYFVLKSNKQIKHGNYKKWRSKNYIMQMKGIYKNGIKDSIWEFFDYYGELQQKYDFTKNELIYFKIADTDKNKKYRLVGSDNSEVLLDRPPVYIGGDAAMFDTLLKTLKSKKNMTQDFMTGNMYISFDIDKTGKATNHKTFHELRGNDNSCSEEILRAVKNLPDTWLPGVLNGQAIDVQFILALHLKCE